MSGGRNSRSKFDPRNHRNYFRGRTYPFRYRNFAFDPRNRYFEGRILGFEFRGRNRGSKRWVEILGFSRSSRSNFDSKSDFDVSRGRNYFECRNHHFRGRNFPFDPRNHRIRLFRYRISTSMRFRPQVISRGSKSRGVEILAYIRGDGEHNWLLSRVWFSDLIGARTKRLHLPLPGVVQSVPPFPCPLLGSCAIPIPSKTIYPFLCQGCGIGK